MNPLKKTQVVTSQVGRPRLNWGLGFNLLSHPARKRLWSRPGPEKGLVTANAGIWWKKL